MQCENGYIKNGVRGILCRKAGEVEDGDMRSTAHALCGHQRFCPNQRCFQMLPGWEKCPLRLVNQASKEIPKKKTARRRRKGEEK